MTRPAPILENAKIAWISPDSSLSNSFRDAFAEANYLVTDDMGRSRAQIALVDVRCAPISVQNIRKFASRARHAAPNGSIIYLVDPLLDASKRAYLQRTGVVVLVNDNVDHIISVCRNYIRLQNIAEEAGERVKSLAAAGALNSLTEPKSIDAPYSLLIAGKPSPLTLSVMTTTRNAGYRVESVLTPLQAMNALETKPYDGAIFLPDQPSDPLRSLAKTLNRKSGHRDFPILLVADEGVSGERFLPPAHINDDLAYTLDRMIRRARQTSIVRDFLNTDKLDRVADPQTKAIGASFYAQHGARLLARAKETGRPFSLLALSIDAAHFETRSLQEIAPVLIEVSDLISNVTRSEDMLARIAPTTFVITLPATLKENAEKIGERLIGVIESTMFKTTNPATGIETLFPISATASSVENTEEMRFEELTARLLATLNQSNKSYAYARRKNT